jgi:hypothetical protein
MKRTSINPILVLRGHHHSAEVWRHDIPLTFTGEFEAGGALWIIKTNLIDCGDSASNYSFTLHHLSGESPEVSLEFVVRVDDWSLAHYVFAAGAVYGGNRFPVRAQGYSPRLFAPDISPMAAPFITDIPRLSDTTGTSRFDLLAGDMAFPCVDYHDAGRGVGLALYSKAYFEGREIGFTVVEQADRSTAEFRVSSPGVRPQRYDFSASETTAPSLDRGRRLAPGETLGLEVKLYPFVAPQRSDFLDKLLQLRSSVGPRIQPSTCPMSKAAELIIEKNDASFWNDKIGLYAQDYRQEGHYYYQNGWCGGLIVTLPQLASRQAPASERSRRNIQTVLEHGMAPSGLFWGKCLSNGLWQADYQTDPRAHIHRQTLTRRQGDALYFGLRQLGWLEAVGITVPAAWDAALKRCAEVMLKTFQKHGQLGQYLDQHTGELLVGGSCSAGIVPAAWVLAEKRWGGGAYQVAACGLAEQLYKDYVSAGITTGGPGDAMQAPDSESCAGVLESFVELADATGQAKWVGYAQAAAALLATWVMPYDYPFPEDTEFARLGMKTTGTVFANAQNKHSAPGICTHSGLGLLRLSRRTGDFRYLELLHEIATALPQFVSRADRPIIAKGGQPLPSGWINERVNTSDWDNNLGGVFYGSTWSESTLLLTWHEVPGLYVRTDLGKAWAFDQISVIGIERLDGDCLQVTLMNPTTFEARLKVIEEDAESAARPWALDTDSQHTLVIPPGETVRFVASAC